MPSMRCTTGRTRWTNEDSQTFTLALYRCNGESCLACVDGEPVAFVSRSQTVDLVEAVRALTLGA